MTDDWVEFLRELLDAGARFLVVGAHAMAVHGVPPNRIDIMTAISGVTDFDAAWDARAAGRRQDLGDLEALGELPPSP